METGKNVGQLKTFREAVGGVAFYPDMPKQRLSDVLDSENVVLDAKIVEGFTSAFGESDFALLLCEDSEGNQFTTLCGGEVVIKKVRKAIVDKLLPLRATIIKPERYYDIV